MTNYRLIWELPLTPHTAAADVPVAAADVEPASTKTTSSHLPLILILRLFLAASKSPWIIAYRAACQFLRIP